MTNLFKKAAMFTDIHWGLKNNSLVHNTDCSNFVDWFIQTAQEQGCETCFFLGDWNHNRATINIQTLQFGLRALERISAGFERVYFIPGNHDLYFREKRDIHSVEWAKHLPNVTIINDWFHHGDVTIAPWLVGNDWKKVSAMRGKYMFGHFELPFFKMNEMVEMPDHGEIQVEHLRGFERVFTGHFHKRQRRDNVEYIGNAFPHNYADAGDDERGMVVLEWDGIPQHHTWDQQPRYRVYKLSDVVNNSDTMLFPNLHCRVNIDLEISYEEANMMRETLMPAYKLREMSLIPMKADVDVDVSDLGDIQFQSVDNIVITQINELHEGTFNKQLLLDIYRNL